MGSEEQAEVSMAMGLDSALAGLATRSSSVGRARFGPSVGGASEKVSKALRRVTEHLNADID